MTVSCPSADEFGVARRETDKRSADPVHALMSSPLPSIPGSRFPFRDSRSPQIENRQGRRNRSASEPGSAVPRSYRSSPSHPSQAVPLQPAQPHRPFLSHRPYLFGCRSPYRSSTGEEPGPLSFRNRRTIPPTRRQPPQAGVLHCVAPLRVTTDRQQSSNHL